MIKGTTGNAVFDFLRDFSSSDYEEFTSKEIEKRRERRSKDTKKKFTTSSPKKTAGTPGTICGVSNSFNAELEQEDKIFKRQLFTMEFSKFAQREVSKVRTDAHIYFYKRFAEDDLRCPIMHPDASKSEAVNEVYQKRTFVDWRILGTLNW